MKEEDLLSFVFDIGRLTFGAIGFEGDDLSAAIGQSDAVRSSDESLIIAGLLVSVVVVSRLILIARF